MLASCPQDIVPRVKGFSGSWAFMPSFDRDYHDFPLSYDNFMATCSYEDEPPDEIYCPCGATIRDWDGTVGHALRLVDHHCAEAGHPKPRHEP